MARHAARLCVEAIRKAPIRFPEFEMTQYRGGNIAPYRRRRSLLYLSNNAAEGDGFNRS